MMFSRWNITLFVLLALAAIAGIAAVPVPLPEGTVIDSRTGAAEPAREWAMERARRSGDAGIALARWREMVRDASPSHGAERWIATLERELSAPSFADVEPYAERLLAADVTDGWLSVALERLSGNAVDGRRTEALFRGSALSGGKAPDALADRALARMLSGRKPALGEVVAVAEAFARVGRPRAQMRWLLRAHRHYPRSRSVTDPLVAFYLAHGRVHEAFAVSTVQARQQPRDARFWERRAELARWVSRPSQEADALELVVEANPGDAVARRRLIELYVYLGQPELGLPHARRLALRAGEIAETEETAETALASGLTDEGLQMLGRIAEQVADPAPWRQRIADLALQDLRIDRAIAELERLSSEVGGGDHERQLEALYRRSDRPEELVALLERRLIREPANEDLWWEAIGLRYALGDDDGALDLQTRHSIASVDPEGFMSLLSAEERAGLARIRQRALSLALGAPGSSVGEVLAELRPFLHRPGFREVAEALLERFPRDPLAKTLRRELLDIDLTPVESARAAERLAATYPDDLDLLRVWIQRAEWANLVDDQIRGRLAVLARSPGDDDNRQALANLLEYRLEHRRALEHWRHLAEVGGLDSSAVPRLIDCLFACGEDAEATGWLLRLSRSPSATWQQKRVAAEQLFYRKGYDQADVLFRAVLETQPDDPLALLRLGQIHSWTNDPRGAIPYLEHRLAVTDDDRAQVLFLLGEAEWAIGASVSARRRHVESVASMLAEEDPSIDVRSMTAMMLARLQRHEEARPLYRSLVEAAPRNVDLVLDFADVLIAEEEIHKAESLARHARTVDPDSARLLRTEGMLLGMLGRYREADASLQRALDLHGPDGGIYAEQSRMRELDGDWDGALDAVGRWLALQTDSSAARRSQREFSDRLADLAVGSFDYRKVGEDRSLRAAIEGSVLLEGDRDRLKAALSYERYAGRAAVVGAGTVDVVEELGVLDFAFERRYAADNRWGAGVTLAAGASGDLPLGVWAGLFLQGSEPFRTLELRAFANEILTEPAAAAGLGGRQSGIDALSYAEFGDGFWGGARAQLASLSIDPPGAGRAGDAQFIGELDLGFRIHDGDTAVADRFRVRRLPSGPLSPFLVEAPERTRNLMVNVWASLQSYHLLDDGELARLIPIARHADYVLGAARVDKHVVRHLGVAASGYAGVEVHDGEGIWGVEGLLTWRPPGAWELTVSGGRGAALGRGVGDDDAYHFHAQAVVRW